MRTGEGRWELEHDVLTVQICHRFTIYSLQLLSLIHIFILRASVKKISIISILAGIFIEPIQLLINLITGFPNYVIDIDDFMLQIAGILVGLFIITLAEKYHILNWLKE